MTHLRRMKLAEYQRHYFIGKPPCLNTLKRMIRDGELAGEVLGNRYYVLIDPEGRPAATTPEAAAAQAANDIANTGNALADAALTAWIEGRAA